MVESQKVTRDHGHGLRLRAIAESLKSGIPWWIGVLLLAGLLLLPDAMAGPLSTFWMRFPGLDKPTHFLAFIVVFLILNGVFRRCEWPVAERRRLDAALAGSLIISLVDEAQQAVVGHGRTAEYGDLVADAAGALAGMTLLSATRLGLHRTLAIIGLLLVPVAAVTVQTYNKRVHINRGMVYEREQNYEQAKAEYLQALKGGFQSAHLYNTIAWLDIEFLEADPAEAKYYAEKALRLDSNNADILDTYGWILVKEGRAHDGLVFLKRAEKMNPKMYCINLHIGLAYREIGDPQRAIEHLQLQVRRNSADRWGRSAKAALHQFEREWADGN